MRLKPLPSSEEESGRLANILGLYVSGDIGDLTIYTTRKGRITAFPKSPPKKPPSPAQLRQRSRFRQAQMAYMALDDATKNAWEMTTRKMSLDATGQNCWISLALNPDEAWLLIAQATTGFALTAPAVVP